MPFGYLGLLEFDTIVDHNIQLQAPVVVRKPTVGLAGEFIQWMGYQAGESTLITETFVSNSGVDGVRTAKGFQLQARKYVGTVQDLQLNHGFGSLDLYSAIVLEPPLIQVQSSLTNTVSSSYNIKLVATWKLLLTQR